MTTEPTSDFPTTFLPLTEAEKNRKAILDRYADGGLILVQAAANLTLDQAQAHPVSGTWSLAELFAHLVDCDLVLADRMKRVIAEDNPTLAAFSENDWLDRLHSTQMPVADAAALFAANRLWMALIVVRSIHHLDHHLGFLYAKRAKLGVAIYPRYATNPGF